MSPPNTPIDASTKESASKNISKPKKSAKKSSTAENAPVKPTWAVGSTAIFGEQASNEESFLEITLLVIFHLK